MKKHAAISHNMHVLDLRKYNTGSNTNIFIKKNKKKKQTKKKKKHKHERPKDVIQNRIIKFAIKRFLTGFLWWPYWMKNRTFFGDNPFLFTF